MLPSRSPLRRFKNSLSDLTFFKDKIDELLQDKELTADQINVLQNVRARADDYSLSELAEQLKKYDAKSPETGNEITDPFPFNLMFSTQIGPTGKFKG